MTVEAIHKQLREFHEQGKRMFISLSFQTHSIPLVHIISTSSVPVDVVFINTGFHFPETLSFKKKVANMLGISLIDIQSSISKHQQRDSEGNLVLRYIPLGLKWDKE